MMDYGVHLPLIATDRRPWSLRRLLERTEVAEGLGFQALAANDHLLFSSSWLDGPTALAALLARAGWTWPPRWRCRSCVDRRRDSRDFQPTSLIPMDASQIIRTREGGER